MTYKMSYEQKKEAHIEEELRRVERELIEQLQQGKLPAISQTSFALGRRLRKQKWLFIIPLRQTPERKKLLATLASQCISPKKVGVCCGAQIWNKGIFGDMVGIASVSIYP